MSTIINIMKNIAKAQAECLKLPMLDDKKNLHSNYTFISYGKLISVVMPVLHKYDLTYFVNTECDGETATIHCSIFDTKNDEVITSSFSFNTQEQFPRMNRAQTFGSYLTYCKKYCLCAMLGLDVGESDEDNFTEQAVKAPIKVEKTAATLSKPVIKFEDL